MARGTDQANHFVKSCFNRFLGRRTRHYGRCFAQSALGCFSHTSTSATQKIAFCQIVVTVSQRLTHRSLAMPQMRETILL